MTRASALLALVLAGCTSADGAGTLVVSASGEEAAVEGYPTTTGIAFTDGWTLAFDEVVVSLDAFHVARGGTATPLEADPVVVDLHDAITTDVWTFPALGARRYDDVGYALVPPTALSRFLGTVSDARREALIARGASLVLHGIARHAARHDVVLDLALPLHVTTSDCVDGTDRTHGLVVPRSGTAEAQMTFHLDHLFFDSIVAAEPALRFEAWAAAAGGDFVVTWDELASQPLADLHDADGAPLLEDGAPIVYDPGSAPLATQDLRSFVWHQATTIGHFDGEGHCAYACIDASGAAQSSCPVPAR